MALKVHKFRDTVEMELFLRGGIIGGLVVPSRGIVGLVGKTLTFTGPAGAVNFVTASREDDALLFKDIKAQVEAALNAANIRVVSVGGKVAFVHPTAASAIALSGNNEEAKALLGFGLDLAVSGKVYGVDPTTPPAFMYAYQTQDNSHVVVTNE